MKANCFFEIFVAYNRLFIKADKDFNLKAESGHCWYKELGNREKSLTLI